MQELEPLAAQAELLPLAAKGVQTASLRSLCTEDESLICRLERDENPNAVRVTVLADRDVWGEIVVIWPGAGDPIPVETGKPVSLARARAVGLEYWIVSGSEATWSGSADRIPESVEGIYNTVRIAQDPGLRLSYTEPALALTMLKESGRWRPLTLPASLACDSPITLALFTPLSAKQLR